MLLFTTINTVKAQFVIGEVIKLTVTKVIKAIDLKVQRMQNKTIWLQNAQKVIENQLSKTKLNEISGWTDQQKQLYSNYYTELWKIKSAISYYQRIKDVTLKQASLVAEYHQAWGLFRQDSHFNAQELNHMQQVYSGILDASVKNLDEILLVVNAYKTQMTDEQRLELINHAGDHLDENYSDLHQFNNQNIQLSLQRSKDLNDTHSIKRLYGIN
ncbi:conjugal transfer protein TraI [Mucilaginibacter sp.]|uniref:conjugal transfer protein TraI n=1 Tax=Mucilaginibacter sp. TaxID=1882438 RepID=UPI00263A2CB9|nr:conjugal transfer protein TraI [Mucilaginibacter sp.]